MENKLEQLLNSLIEKGWKPNWLEKNDIQNISYDKDRKEISIQYIKWCTTSKFDLVPLLIPLRRLTSKESWLWQFVCENRMVEHRNYWIDTEIWQDEQYKYRLIESALCDEDKLEEFLLNSIKLD